MKTIFAIILLFVGFVASAQTVALAPIRTGSTLLTVTTDYVLTNTTARTFTINAPQQFPCTQDYLVNIDSTSGNHTNVAVALYGQKFATGAYAQIGSTVNWKGTTADTTIIISNATATRYLNYKVTITGTGNGTSTIDLQQLKLYFE